MHFNNIKTIIVDIDDTLVSGEFSDIDLTYTHKLTHHAVVDFVNQADNIFVVTGRNESLRNETEKLLSNIGLRYNNLYMNPNHYSLSDEHKNNIASILSTSNKIDLAIDDNKDVREIYNSYGIEALDPALIFNSIDMLTDQIVFQD